MLYLVASVNETAVAQRLGPQGTANITAASRRLLSFEGDAYLGRSLLAVNTTVNGTVNSTTNATGNATATGSTSSTTNSTNTTASGALLLCRCLRQTGPTLLIMLWKLSQSLPASTCLRCPPNYTLTAGLGSDLGHPIESMLANSSEVSKLQGKAPIACGLQPSNPAIPTVCSPWVVGGTC